MFAKRKLEFKLTKVKPVTEKEQQDAQDQFNERLEEVASATKGLMLQAALLGAGYIVLDTGRKVAVAFAQK